MNDVWIHWLEVALRVTMPLYLLMDKRYVPAILSSNRPTHGALKTA